MPFINSYAQAIPGSPKSTVGEAIEEPKMKAFKIYLNGQYLLTAGIGDDGVLTSILSWVGGSAPRSSFGRLNFHVGGIDSTTEEHVDWSIPSVNVGDEITMKIIDADHISPENRRYKRDK